MPSANNLVLIYLSPVSARITTIVSPAASNSEASGRTASEFPDNGSVKTSTTVYEGDLVRVTGREPPRSGLSLHRIRTALALRQTRFGRACCPLQILGRAVPTRHSPQGAAP